MSSSTSLIIDQWYHSEILYRWCTLAIACVFAFVLLKSIKKSGNAFDINTWIAPEEGFILATTIRITIACQFTGVIVYWNGGIISLDKFTRLAYYTSFSFMVPTVIRWFSVITFFIGVALLYQVLTTLGRNYSMSLHTREKHTLVQDGPYGYVRHPMYTVLFICWMSISILSANGIIAISSLAMLTLVMFFRTPIEERMMRKGFGQSYDVYCEKIPYRFFPHLL